MLSLIDQHLTLQGKAMTGTLRAMHAESMAAFAKMQALVYDPLDLSQQAFVADYAAFQIAINGIERRLAGILRMVGQQPLFQHKHLALCFNRDITIISKLLFTNPLAF